MVKDRIVDIIVKVINDSLRGSERVYTRKDKSRDISKEFNMIKMVAHRNSKMVKFD